MVTVSLDSPSGEVTLFDPVYRWFIGTLPDRPRDYTVWSTLEPSGVDSRTWAGIIQVGSATIMAAVVWPVLREEERKEEDGAPTGGVGRLDRRKRGAGGAERAGPGAVVRGESRPWWGKKEKSWAACGRGKGGPRGGLGHSVGLLLYFPFLFIFQSNSIYLNFQIKFGFKLLCTHSNKTYTPAWMHKHVEPKINFNSLWNLIKLNAS
jgi:hypothetical protein